jgi:hypothetical protein
MRWFSFFYWLSLQSLIGALEIDLLTEPYDAYSTSLSPPQTSESSHSLLASLQNSQNQRVLSLSLSGDRVPQPTDPIFQSPSNGTDILHRPVQLIRCQNQSTCIQPKLQLVKKYSVYYCK